MIGMPKERIYVNMVYVIDGMWGIAGKAYTLAELGAAIREQTAAE